MTSGSMKILECIECSMNFNCNYSLFPNSVSIFFLLLTGKHAYGLWICGK